MKNLAAFLNHLLELEDPEQIAREILGWGVQHYETDFVLACAPASLSLFVSGTSFDLTVLVRQAREAEGHAGEFLKLLHSKLFVLDEKGDRDKEQSESFIGECYKTCFLALAELGLAPPEEKRDFYSPILSRLGVDLDSLPWGEPQEV